MVSNWSQIYRYRIYGFKCDHRYIYWCKIYGFKAYLPHHRYIDTDYMVLKLFSSDNLMMTTSLLELVSFSTLRSMVTKKFYYQIIIIPDLIVRLIWRYSIMNLSYVMIPDLPKAFTSLRLSSSLPLSIWTMTWKPHVHLNNCSFEQFKIIWKCCLNWKHSDLVSLLCQKLSLPRGSTNVHHYPSGRWHICQRSLGLG